MARSRKGLSPIFKEILDNPFVYYQSPGPNIVKYPCIVYELSDKRIDYANNFLYKDMNRYTVTLISKVPDNDEYIDQIVRLPYCSYDRRFISENLYHDVFDLFY